MTLTTWNRLQPSNLAGDITAGLQAPVADPLWMLGRQWQVGELTAEDAGTPVAASIETTSFAIDRLVVGATTRVIDGSIALEALVEPEPPAPPDVRMRLTGGRNLVAALRRDGFTMAASKVASRFAMTPPEDDRTAATLVRAIGAVAIDAEPALAAYSDDPGALVYELEPGAAPAALQATLDGWAAHYRATTGRVAPSA